MTDTQDAVAWVMHEPRTVPPLTNRFLRGNATFDWHLVQGVDDRFTTRAGHRYIRLDPVPMATADDTPPVVVQPLTLPSFVGGFKCHLAFPREN